jgi:uncharacterized protein (TIGR00255 family)
MTGFARAAGHDESLSWTWEIKSVNGRSLDMRFRLPAGFDRVEAAARDLVAQRFKRGSFTGTLVLARVGSGGGWRVNRELIDQLLSLHQDFAGRIAPGPPRLDALLAVRGVVEQVEGAESEAAAERRLSHLIASFEEALGALAAARAAEGARLLGVLGEHLDGIAALAEEAGASAALQPAALGARLREQLAALRQDEPALSEERIAQEAAMLVAKADVREELDRLKAHVGAARELLAQKEAVGRRLDFLCQEFNREANTLCSKAAELELTRIGLALKAAIEQFREQVQNVE